jgi:hypothetical protein
VVFRLPPTLPIQIPIKGLVRDPYIANPPLLYITKAEITSKGTIQGRAQAPFVVDPSKVIIVPFAEVISRVLYKGIVQDIPTVFPSRLIAFIAPSVIPLVPAIIALRAVSQRPYLELPPSVATLSTTEIVSNVTIRGLPQDVIIVGLPKSYNPIAEITSNVVIRGLIQDVPLVGLPKILSAIAEIVKQGLTKGLPQDLILVGPSEIIFPTPAEIVSAAVIRGIIQDRLLVEPSRVVRPPRVVGVVFLTGITRSCPNLAPLAGVTVLAFRTSDNLLVGNAVSDGGGNYSIQVASGVAHYLVAYLPSAPDVFGTTRNDLFGI